MPALNIWSRQIVAASLAVEFNVSEDAVRRDLRALAAEGKCRRVYGGALPFSRPRSPSPRGSGRHLIENGHWREQPPA
ncbi:DeoR family transcriptional regulator [Rhizobium sp. RCAM05973]|uniref:DeoR family transcriptional regulator n=1 Tax=Rhizobium sp. RCAM05973 TaxID=2994066 RepID=UPI0022EBDBA0|nr:DeoR family transcriptional regulator [Rhizobium sp. RCAM05973]